MWTVTGKVTVENQKINYTLTTMLFCILLRHKKERNSPYFCFSFDNYVLKSNFIHYSQLNIYLILTSVNFFFFLMHKNNWSKKQICNTFFSLNQSANFIEINSSKQKHFFFNDMKDKLLRHQFNVLACKMFRIQFYMIEKIFEWKYLTFAPY